jgi:hypothetical protein
MTKKDVTREKYGFLSIKIAQTDILSLDNSLCGSGGSIYNKDNS